MGQGASCPLSTHLGLNSLVHSCAVQPCHKGLTGASNASAYAYKIAGDLRSQGGESRCAMIGDGRLHDSQPLDSLDESSSVAAHLYVVSLLY